MRNGILEIESYRKHMLWPLVGNSILRRFLMLQHWNKLQSIWIFMDFIYLVYFENILMLENEVEVSSNGLKLAVWIIGNQPNNVCKGLFSTQIKVGTWFWSFLFTGAPPSLPRAGSSISHAASTYEATHVGIPNGSPPYLKLPKLLFIDFQ